MGLTTSLRWRGRGRLRWASLPAPSADIHDWDIPAPLNNYFPSVRPSLSYDGVQTEGPDNGVFPWWGTAIGVRDVLEGTSPTQEIPSANSCAVATVIDMKSAVHDQIR